MANVVLVLPVASKSSIHDEQGIALITSYLRKNGHKVQMVAITEDEDLKAVDWSRFDIAGITSYHFSLPFAYRIAEYIKSACADIYVCLGGYSATYYSDDILKDCAALDFIIMREGELTFLDICKKIDSGSEFWDIPGIIYRKDNRIVQNDIRDCIPNLDDLPFSAKDIYREHNLNLVQISTSRGCTNNCSFCYSHSYFDPKVRWRGRSVESVVEEVKKISEEEECGSFYFNNASFEDSLPPFEFARQFSKTIVESGIDIAYFANFRANFYRFCDEELINSLVESGLTAVFLGIEAFNEHDLKVYNKHTTVKDNLESIAFFEKYGIGLDIGFINFNPYSTIESLRENEKYLYQTGFLSSLKIVSRIMAFRGTALYGRMLEDGLVKEDNYLDYHDYSFENPDIEKLVKYLYSIFSGKYASIPDDMYRFTMYNNQLVPHMKRVFRRNEQLVAMVDEYNADRKAILNECNEFCHIWYVKLLDITQNGWDTAAADTYLEQMGVLEKMLEFSTRLKQRFFMFVRKAQKLDTRVAKMVL